MKTLACRPAVAASVSIFVFGSAHAQIRKENNIDPLNLPGSWVLGAAPGPGDIAQWDNQLPGANSSDLGAPLSWLGMRVTNPGGAVTVSGTSPNNLTLGSSGIDMSTATQNLTITSPLVLGAAQPWSVASGRALRITSPGVGAISGTGPLTVNGPGQVRIGGLAATYTFTGGISMSGGSGLNNVAFAGSPIAANSNLFVDFASITPGPTGTGPTLGLPAVTAGGGILHSIGGAGTSGQIPFVLSVGSLTVAAGQTNVTMQRGASARMIWQFNGTTARSAGGTANFRDDIGSNGANNVNGGGYRMSTGALVNGIVPFVTYTRSTSGSVTGTTGTSWFVPAGTGTNGANFTGFTASSGVSLGTAAQNSTVTSDVLLSATPAVVNSMYFSDATARTVTIDVGNSLTLGAGAILVTNNGTANHTITGGTLMGGSPGSGSGTDLIVHQHNNTSSLTINSLIADNITPTALTKSGAGTLIIGGTTSYTGATYVNAGTLVVNGALTNSPAVTVNRGGTLGGTGGVPGPVTVHGTLAPGAGVGTLSTGALAFSNGASLTVEIVTSSVTADKVIVAGGVTTGGKTVGLALSDPGSSVVLPEGTRFTIVDYTGAWPGTDLLTYQGNPVADNSTISFGANIYTVKYADAAVDGTALTLTAISTPFKEWINGFIAQLPDSADREAAADPDGDGRNNLIEFALNGDPVNGASLGGLSVSTDDTNDTGTERDLSLTLAARNNAVLGAGPNGSVTLTADGLVYTVEAGQSLLAWDSAVNEVGAFPLVPAPAAGWTARTFRVSDSNGLPDKRFIRVHVTRQ